MEQTENLGGGTYPRCPPGSYAYESSCYGEMSTAKQCTRAMYSIGTRIK